MNQAERDDLWLGLYVMLCGFPTVRSSLANLPQEDKVKLDEIAGQIIATHLRRGSGQ